MVAGDVLVTFHGAERCIKVGFPPFAANHHFPRRFRVTLTPATGNVLHRKASPNLRVQFSRRSFRRIVEALKMEWPPDVMRHSFASYLLAKTGDPADVALQLGHSQGSSVLWDHYRALVSAKDAERFFGIYPDKTSTKARRRATSAG